MNDKERIRQLEIMVLEMGMTRISPPMFIVDNVEDAINQTPNLSLGAINKFRGFTLEGYERLLEENKELKEQISKIREIVGDDNEQDPDYIN